MLDKKKYKKGMSIYDDLMQKVPDKIIEDDDSDSLLIVKGSKNKAKKKDKVYG